MRHATLGRSAIAVAVMGMFSIAVQAEDTVKTDKIDVISTTPLPSLGLPLQYIPYSVQTVKGVDLKKQNSLSIADYMNQNLNGVSVNDTQNNPFQPDVSFRGFSASPLLGTPQGLSVFVDGVRVNEPFGDVVNWDLIPVNAIQNVTVIPGSNPLFGLNTLGGALSVQTKSGRTNQGGAIEASTGSWGRKAVSGEYGGVSKDGSVDYFFSANSFRDDGWRDHSPTDVRQLFGKVGWQNESTKIDLSYTGADNNMIGNGLIPTDMMRTLSRDSILTRPDQTKNTMSFINLNGSHWFSDDVMYSANLYYRGAKTKTLNGDGNDDQEIQDAIADGDAVDVNDALAQCAAGAEESDELCNGAINRTSSRRTGLGFSNQLTFNQDLLGLKNQFITGFGYDYGRTKFKQSTEYGTLNASRGIDGNGVFNELNDQVRLKGVSKTWSVFATDTLSLSSLWHLTMSARYNHTKVENKDGLDAIHTDPDESLTANHSFNRINPAIGLNFTPNDALTVYGIYNEGSRAPTAIELGCANPEQTCKLPNAFAGDPPLKQVVAKTYEAGLRGLINNSVSWSLSAYRTQNTDDIQFISSNAVSGEGYFSNVGKTRRVGLDAALRGVEGKFTWSAGYSLVHATYESGFELVNEANSSSEVLGVDANGDDIEGIRVKKGNRIPGIPKHQLKLRAGYDITPAWNVGGNLIAFTEQYVRGNENNKHRADEDNGFFGSGKLGGYAVVNLDTRYNFGNGWQVFGRVNNVFDREFNNGGLLGESLFTANGQFNGGDESNRLLVAPGAPRAGWIGLRYEFGGPKNAVASAN